MNIRKTVREDFQQIIKLLSDDYPGSQRKVHGEPLPQCYTDAFNKICVDTDGTIYVVVDDDTKEVVGCFQITFIQYLSLKGSWRTLIENVRVAKNKSGNGVGTAILKYVTALSKLNDVSIIQLMCDKTHDKAHRFYEISGFEATHVGMK